MTISPAAHVGGNERPKDTPALHTLVRSPRRLLAQLRAAAGLYSAVHLREAGCVDLTLATHGRPRRLLWRHTVRLPRPHAPVLAARLALEPGHLVVCWRDCGRVLRVEVRLPNAQPRPAPSPAVLGRPAANPILAPLPAHDWESVAVFNAGAIGLHGRVHFIYRAIGRDGRSVFGYAASSDGITIDERGDAPAFVDDGLPAAMLAVAAAGPSVWRSGPSHCGCEDPRLTLIEDTVYMTYTRFDGHHPPGVAITAIGAADFAARRWHWRAPVLISAPHEAHKNWVVFPERIAGRYALLHGISPGIMLDAESSLEFVDGDCVPSHYARSGREDAWDTLVRGAGPPPIRTRAGWLLIYHAMDRRDPGRYKLGAMLLDLHDPCRIVGRLPHPLLAPDARYENEGMTPGVVYACGAVLLGERLHVYYGGADTVLCTASVELEALLEQLVPGKASSPPRPSCASRSPAHARARSRQPAAVGQQGIDLGARRGVQPERRPGRRHLAPRLSRAIGDR